jgi:hypothetical protein
VWLKDLALLAVARPRNQAVVQVWYSFAREPVQVSDA